MIQIKTNAINNTKLSYIHTHSLTHSSQIYILTHWLVSLTTIRYLKIFTVNMWMYILFTINSKCITSLIPRSCFIRHSKKKPFTVNTDSLTYSSQLYILTQLYIYFLNFFRVRGGLAAHAPHTPHAGRAARKSSKPCKNFNFFKLFTQISH